MAISALEWVRRGLGLFGEELRSDVQYTEALERFQIVEQDAWEMWKQLTSSSFARTISKDERALYDTLRTTVYTTATRLREAALRFGVPSALVPQPAKLPSIGKRIAGVPVPVRGSSLSGFAVPMGSRLPRRQEMAGTLGWAGYAVGIVAVILALVAAGLIATGRLSEIISPELYGRIRLAEIQLDTLRNLNVERDREWTRVQEAIAAGIDPALVPRAAPIDPLQIGGPPPGSTLPWLVRGAVVVAVVGGVGYGVYKVLPMLAAKGAQA